MLNNPQASRGIKTSIFDGNVYNVALKKVTYGWCGKNPTYMNRSRYGTSKSFMRVGDWKCTQQAGVRFHWPQSCSILQHVFYIVLLLSTRQVISPFSLQ
jgi:hypothetical protein